MLKLFDRENVDDEAVAVWKKKILEGDPKFWSMMLDRVEGPIGPQAERSGADDDIETLREFVKTPKRRPRKGR